MECKFEVCGVSRQFVLRIIRRESVFFIYKFIHWWFIDYHSISYDNINLKMLFLVFDNKTHKLISQRSIKCIVNDMKFNRISPHILPFIARQHENNLSSWKYREKIFGQVSNICFNLAIDTSNLFKNIICKSHWKIRIFFNTDEQEKFSICLECLWSSPSSPKFCAFIWKFFWPWFSKQ